MFNFFTITVLLLTNVALGRSEGLQFFDKADEDYLYDSWFLASQEEEAARNRVTIECVLN